MTDEALISSYQEQISKLETEVSELQDAKSKLAMLQSNLSGCKTTSAEKLTRVETLDKINKTIVNKFYNGMTDLLSGYQYRNVNAGLETGITKIDTEINKKMNEIATCNSNITACGDRIQEMNNTIAWIEAEEARRAEGDREEATEEKISRRSVFAYPRSEWRRNRDRKKGSKGNRQMKTKYKVIGTLAFIIATFTGLILMILIGSVVDDFSLIENYDWVRVGFLILVFGVSLLVGIYMVYSIYNFDYVTEKKREKEEIAQKKRMEGQKKIAEIKRKKHMKEQEKRDAKEAERASAEREKKAAELKRQEQGMQFIDRPLYNMPQRVRCYYNKSAGLGVYTLILALVVLMIACYFGIVMAMEHLEGNLKLTVEMVLAFLFYLGLNGFFVAGAYASGYNVKAFAVTSENFVYYVSFIPDEEWKMPYSRIGKLIYAIKRKPKSEARHEEMVEYIQSPEMPERLAAAINDNVPLECNCIYRCLNSPRIERKNLSGCIIKYWDEKLEKWAEIQLLRSNEGYKEICQTIERRMRK